MKYRLVILAALLFSFSCNEPAEQKSETAETSETPTVEQAPDITPEADVGGLGIPVMIRGEYLSAAVYAGATDYEFLLDDGEKVLIRVSKEEGAENPRMPPAMLESGSDLEGPPGANPKKVGKFFTLQKNAEGKFTRVIYSEGKPPESE